MQYERTVRLRYKKGILAFILFTLLFSSMFFMIDGILVGTIMVVIAVIYSSTTHNCYGVDIAEDKLCVRMIYSENVTVEAKKLNEVRLGKPHEEMRLMGNSRYICFLLSDGVVSKYNIEPVASLVFEDEIEKFCIRNSIVYKKNVDS